MYRRIIDLLHDIVSLSTNLHGKRDLTRNQISYYRAMHLFYITLQKTYDELEDVYFHYILHPEVKLIG